MTVTNIAHLNCTFQSFPSLSFIDWYFTTSDGLVEDLTNNSRAIIALNSLKNNSDGTIITSSTLTIINVTIADDGQYMCRTGEPFALAVANITVQCKSILVIELSICCVLFIAPPVVTTVAREVIGVITYQITLTFNITGAIPSVNPSDIRWTTKRELTAGQRVTFSMNRHSVTISNLSLLDQGNYFVTAVNPAGISTSVIYLDVQGSHGCL